MVLAFVVWAALLPVAILVVRRSPEAIGLRPEATQGSASAVDASPGDWPVGRAMRTRAFDWRLSRPSDAYVGPTRPFVFGQTRETSIPCCRDSPT